MQRPRLLLCKRGQALRPEQRLLTVWSGSAEARRHHELREDTGGCGGAEVAPQQEHGATGPAGCQQRCPIPEGDQSEGTFTQNCRREAMLVQQWLLLQSVHAVSAQTQQIPHALHH